MSQHAKGLVITTLAMLVITPDALLIRLIVVKSPYPGMWPCICSASSPTSASNPSLFRLDEPRCGFSFFLVSNASASNPRYAFPLPPALGVCIEFMLMWPVWLVLGTAMG